MTELPVRESGVFSDISAADYHRDPVAGGSLSSTGARRLLPPSCPAKFKHERDHGRADTDAFRVGRATHTRVLGVGEPIKVIAGSGKDPNSWATNDTKAAVAQADADGYLPLKPKEHEQVEGMAAAVLRHRTAGALLEPGRGHREHVMVTQDPETGVWLRTMIDAHTELVGIGPVIVDLKSTASAEPAAIAASVERFGYHCQDPFYSDIFAALFGVEPTFLFVFVEKDPPHVVTVHQLTEADRSRGRERNRKAIDIYARCVAADHWPGYSDDIVLNDAPGWAVAQHEAAWRRGDLDPTYQIGAA